MKAKSVLALFVSLVATLHAPVANGQYTTSPGGSPAGSEAVAERESAGNSAGLGLAYVTFLSGESLLKSTDDEDWVALSPNLSLRIGDRVWSQDGARVEIRFPLGATAWVNYHSELDITRMERGARADTIQLALVSGEAAFDVKRFARPGSVFQVDVPNASIRAAGAARFRVNTLPDGTAQIGVISGSLVLETPEGLTDVRAGLMVELQPDRRVLLDFLPAGDAWDAWVQSRAGIYDRPAASLQYLPADLSAYAHEFDTSGRWLSDPGYGTVWVPAVDRDWSPYANGRWVWQANDYVWLAYDPWYAPFHYGRWSWKVSLGWFWIAPRGRAHWSPGYVGWSIVGDEVCWVPLGHNEIYYGYGNFGPGSVNVLASVRINVANVYVNSRVANGVVVVRKDDFLRGRIARVRIAPSRNPFAGRGAGGVAVIGRPPVLEIKPIRETRHPRPEVEIKRLSLPPVRLEHESRTIKVRTVAPTKEKSVFSPGRKPAPLKNIVKERELQIWVPPKKTPAPKAVVVPPPAGKHQFKRLPEPRGGADAAPVRVLVPRERLKGDKSEKGEKEDRSSEEKRKK